MSNDPSVESKSHFHSWSRVSISGAELSRSLILLDRLVEGPAIPPMVVPMPPPVLPETGGYPVGFAVSMYR